MRRDETFIILIIYLKSDLRDKISLRNYCTGFVALLAQLYVSGIVDLTIVGLGLEQLGAPVFLVG
jgi:hypothetical protein